MVIVTALVAFISTLIGIIYRNLKNEIIVNHDNVMKRLNQINGTICNHDGCLDEHEKRLIREEERRRAHEHVAKEFSRQLERLAQKVEDISTKLNPTFPKDRK